MRKILMVTLVALVFSAPGYAQDNATVQRLADQFAEAFNNNELPVWVTCTPTKPS